MPNEQNTSQNPFDPNGNILINHVFETPIPVGGELFYSSGSPPPQPAWWTDQLPPALHWHRAPTAIRVGNAPTLRLVFNGGSAYCDSEAVWVDAYADLLVWLNRYALRAYVHSDEPVGDGIGQLPLSFKITPVDEEYNGREATQVFLDTSLCGVCNTEHLEAYHGMCPVRAGSPLHLPFCDRCGWVTRESARVITQAGGTYNEYSQMFCTGCLGTCSAEGCEETSLSPFEFCTGCAELQATCVACSTVIEFEDASDFEGVTVDGTHWCDTCSEHVCFTCHYPMSEDALMADEQGRTFCPECFATSGTETNDTGDTIAADHMRLRTIPGREQIRMCGIEIEGAVGDYDGEELARRFHDQGISSTDGVAGYHHGRGLGFAHVEHDSSVDWEAVIGPVNMADREHVRQLNMAVRTIRSMVHADELRLDMRCGLHIHIGAERASLEGAFNLNTLFAYVEDPMYRLAAARWPMHRALVNSHYTQPVLKDAKTKVEFGNLISRAERYHALSFTNYINTMLNNCQCGAVRYDSWDQCTCDLGKCTFEFRLFNSTANPTKLHAYLALTQALVAKALSMDAADREKFASMEFIKRRFKDMDNPQQESVIPQWDERLEWMFTELPLTDGEKNSLLYVAKNSELLSLGERRLHELAAADYQPTIEEVTA